MANVVTQHRRQHSHPARDGRHQVTESIPGALFSDAPGAVIDLRETKPAAPAPRPAPEPTQTAPAAPVEPVAETAAPVEVLSFPELLRRAYDLAGGWAALGARVPVNSRGRQRPTVARIKQMWQYDISVVPGDEVLRGLEAACRGLGEPGEFSYDRWVDAAKESIRRKRGDAPDAQAAPASQAEVVLRRRSRLHSRVEGFLTSHDTHGWTEAEISMVMVLLEHTAARHDQARDRKTPTDGQQQ